MGVNIKDYQNAYEAVVTQLRENSQIVAIVVYGSMVSGDIWEESDIDFLVITKEKGKFENIYAKISRIPIHINYLSKDEFINSYNRMLKGGTFHKAFFTGKMVYCSDKDIEEIHVSSRFYSDRDRYARNIEILCNVINAVHYTKKYLCTGKIETAYQWSIDILTSYARLVVGLEGHITDKDILSFAVNVNPKVEHLFKIVESQAKTKEKINEILKNIENFLESNIAAITSPIVEFLKASSFPCSAEDIKNSRDFKQIEADITLLLDRMSRADIIKEGSRKYMTYGDEALIDEITYFVE